MVFRVPGSPRQVRKALVNPAWPDDPMSGQAVESQGGSRSREFADVRSSIPFKGIGLRSLLRSLVHLGAIHPAQPRGGRSCQTRDNSGTSNTMDMCRSCKMYISYLVVNLSPEQTPTHKCCD